MATKDRNVERQSAFSVGKLHKATGFQRGNNAIVSVGNAGIYKAIANEGIVTITGSQAFRDPCLAGFGDDYFNGWVLIHQGNCRNTSLLTKGQMNIISDYHDDGTFDTDWDWKDPDDNTAAVTTFYVQAGEEFLLMPMELLPDGMMKWENAVVMTATPTTGTQASHEVFTVTGLVEVKLLNLVTTSLTGSGADIEFGVASDMDMFIATMADAEDLDATDIWSTATDADNVGYQFAPDCIFHAILDGQDIGYDVNNANITAGVIKFICWWKPLEFGATVIPAVGTATL